MDVVLSNDYYHFVYDPQLYGFNTAYWRELNGSASLTATNKIRVNSLTIASKQQYFHGDFTFMLSVAGSPTGLIRRWGLISPALSTSQNALYFEENAGVFQAVVVNDSGTATTSTITWNSSSWNGVAIPYNITWSRNTVVFSISGVPVATFQDRNLTPGYVPLPVSITNQEMDNLDVTYIIGKHIEKVVDPAWELPVVSTISTVTDLAIEGVKESSTLTESSSASINATLTPSPSVNEAVTMTESITLDIIARNFGVSDAITMTESKTVSII